MTMWNGAVVGRLRLLLEETPNERFNVTQSYALFTSILCWVLQRIRVPEDDNVSQDDRNAHKLFRTLSEMPIKDDPWRMHVLPTPRIVSIGSHTMAVPASENFEAYSAFQFMKALRDATAHGDARNVSPFNFDNFLVGFSFSCAEFKGKGKTRRKIWQGKVTLLESDMQRIGRELARMYCDTIRRSDPHNKDNSFGRDATSIQETAA